MRKLTFAFMLFCCSNAVLAADPCVDLNGHPMSIVANNYQAVTGEIDFFPNTQSFVTSITFTNQAPDTMAGTCYNGHITFTRTHPNPGGYVQFYDGSSTDFAWGEIKGTYSNGKISHSWHGTVLTFSGISDSSSASTPTTSTPAQIAACQQKCFDEFAEEKTVGTGVLVCKKACLNCKQKCH